jgi:cytochrome P450
LNWIDGQPNLFSQVDHDRWQRLRKSSLHAFSPLALRSQVRVLQSCLKRWFDSVLDPSAEKGEALKFDDSVQVMAFDVICQVAYGLDFNVIESKDPEHREFLDILKRLLPELLAQAGDPFRKFKNLPAVKQFPIDKTRISQLADKFMSQASALPPSDDGERRVISIWSAVEKVEGLTHGEKLANFILFVMAGHDTTAHATSFTLYNLLVNSEAMQKVVAEVDAALPDFNALPDLSHMTQLNYLTMCVKESLRMYPTGTGTMRILSESKTLDGIHLEKGTMVAVHSLMMNYSKCWDNPKAFIPERWTKEEEAKRPKTAFFTFSTGPRDCIGKTLALNEIVLTVAAVLRRYKVSLEPGYKFVFKTGFTSYPLYDLPVKLKKRD